VQIFTINRSIKSQFGNVNSYKNNVTLHPKIMLNGFQNCCW
jgi:hypothetical protein